MILTILTWIGVAWVLIALLLFAVLIVSAWSERRAQLGQLAKFDRR